MRWVRLLFFLVLIACLSPVIAVAIAGSIANRHGCTLNEGAIHPCVIDGVDYGRDLYTLAMMGWLMIATLPVAAGTIVLWVVIEAVRWWRRARAGRA
jgi:hypothetical protein